MKKILIHYPNDWRKLKQLITILLKKHFVDFVQVLNYSKNYSLVDNKIIKDEEKLLIISYSDKMEDIFFQFLKKQVNSPIEIIYLNDCINL